LLQEAHVRNVACDVLNPLECQLLIQGKHSAILVGSGELPHYDVVLPRIGASITDFGLAVVKQFETLGMNVVNGSRAIAESRDKLRCLQILSGQGIPVPPSLLSRSPKLVRTAEALLGGFPLILKLLRGTQGVGVMMVHSAASMSSVMDTLRGLGEDALAQQFLSKGAGHDFRAFVIGNQVVAAMKRTAAKGEFRSNIHRGGEGTLVKLSAQQRRVAIRAAQSLNLAVAGVDLMESSAGPLVLEVNSSPGFEGIEKATGLNVAGMIMDLLIKSTSKGTVKNRTRRK